ncbi:T9SS type A sorting domain-containing protein [bacterium]|nr:T9SS type A sorting domain-containing protein [bacterium]
MKTSLTVLLLFLCSFSFAQISTTKLAHVQFTEFDKIHQWTSSGTKTNKDTIVIRVNWVDKTNPAPQYLVYEMKLVVPMNRNMSFQFSDPNHINTAELNSVCKIQLEGKDVFTLNRLKSKGKSNKESVYDVVWGMAPIEQWSSSEIVLDKPGVDLFYKTSTLPATFVDLRYWSESNVVYVQWTTANEKDVDFYYLEKLDGHGHYMIIDSVSALNNGNITHYVGMDRNPEENNVYRVIGRDRDFIQFFTKDFSVYVKPKEPIVMVHPNPAQDLMTINVAEMELKEYVSIKIVNLDGRVVAERTTAKDDLSLDVSLLQPGIYSVYVESTFIHRFIKN